MFSFKSFRVLTAVAALVTAVTQSLSPDSEGGRKITMNEAIAIGLGVVPILEIFGIKINIDDMADDLKNIYAQVAEVLTVNAALQALED